MAIGAGGDFTLTTGDPEDWFSHQHGIAPLDGVGYEFLLFDNGNTRCEGAGTDCHSRAQDLLLDPGAALVHVYENRDLGDYSSARGMSEELASADTHFTLGTLGAPGDELSRSLEFSSTGDQIFALECGNWAYRSYRIRSMEAPR